MTLNLNHINKPALSALLFICVYHVVRLLMQGSFVVSLVFFSAALLCAHTLMKEQNNTQKSFHNNYAYALGSTFGVSESAKTFILIEKALALTVVFLLSGIIQKLIYDLEAKLNIAKETDSLTGCIQSDTFKTELEKAVQLHERYETPFSVICIKYQNLFNTEADLQTWLKELSRLYQSRLRKTDVLCRFNTQKFMILLPSTNITNAKALSIDLENCVSAYEFSFKSGSSITSESPTLTFSTETFVKNDNIDDWFRKIQSQ